MKKDFINFCIQFFDYLEYQLLFVNPDEPVSCLHLYITLSFQTESGGRPPYLSSGNGHKISSVKGNRRSVQLLLKHKDLSGTKNIAMVILSGMALNCTVMKF